MDELENAVIRKSQKDIHACLNPLNDFPSDLHKALEHFFHFSEGFNDALLKPYRTEFDSVMMTLLISSADPAHELSSFFEAHKDSQFLFTNILLELSFNMNDENTISKILIQWMNEHNIPILHSMKTGSYLSSRPFPPKKMKKIIFF